MDQSGPLNKKNCNFFFFNKFLFLFLSNLQTQLLHSKNKHRNFQQETNK